MIAKHSLLFLLQKHNNVQTPNPQNPNPRRPNTPKPSTLLLSHQPLLRPQRKMPKNYQTF